MVVISSLATDPTGTLQLRTAFPLTCTVQAPQAAIPQPNFVPVKCSSSRRTQSRGASGSTSSSSRTTPFTMRRIPTLYPLSLHEDGRLQRLPMRRSPRARFPATTRSTRRRQCGRHGPNPRGRFGSAPRRPIALPDQFAYFTEQPYGRVVPTLTGRPAIASVSACDT